MSKNFKELFLGTTYPLEKSSILNAEEFRKNGILYHSKRDPRREAARQLLGLEQDGEFLILLGSGLGYILAEAKNQYKEILLIEPDADVLQYLLQNDNLKELENIISIYHPENSAQDDLEDILLWLQGKNVQKIRILPFRPAFNALPDLYIPLQKQLLALLERRSVNQATIVKFQDIWNRNILLNLPQLVTCSAYEELTNHLQVDHVVIAGAGPSLADSIPELQKYRQKFLLAAADTALIPLVKNQIFPDVVFAADPQWINHFFAYSRFTDKSVWVVDPVVSPGLFHNISHAVTVNWDNAFRLYTIFSDIFGLRGEIRHGGSVSTNAFDFARKIATKKILLVGQDFAFSGGQAHVKGAALESLLFANCNRFITGENHNYRQMSALPKLAVDSIVKTDQRIFSNAKLKIIQDWFERRSGETSSAEILNCTARGARLKNWRHSTLNDELQSVEAKVNLNLTELKNSQISEERKIQEAALIKKLQVLRKELLELVNHCKRVLIKGNLHDLESKLRHLPLAKDIASLGAQSQILKITEQGAQVEPTAFVIALKKSAENVALMLKKTLGALHSPA
ncbi:MAG: motility associated factor glycosyltransferase family protein [Leptospiraceae bacterium]|nr:motility associated factor glycosyltransferase family protein [Leptospiraceae bacterium]